MKDQYCLQLVCISRPEQVVPAWREYGYGRVRRSRWSRYLWWLHAEKLGIVQHQKSWVTFSWFPPLVCRSATVFTTCIMLGVRHCYRNLLKVLVLLTFRMAITLTSISYAQQLGSEKSIKHHMSHDNLKKILKHTDQIWNRLQAGLSDR